jgi:non-ribosomal peptide synthetase component F
MERYTQTHHLTPSTLIQGVWAYLLANYTGQGTVVYGVTVAGRPTELPDAEHRVGLYINTLPFRATLAEEQRVVDWLTGLQQGHSQAREYSYSPLTTIQGWLGLKGEWFNSLFVFENYPIGDAFFQPQRLRAEDWRVEEQTNYPLTIVVTAGQQLTVDFCYYADLLPAVVIQRIQAHFAHVLRQIVYQPDLRLDQIELVTEEEKRAAVGRFQ